MAVIEITKDNFEAEVLNSDKTVLIDFWATWCGPCQMLSPVVDEFAQENPQIKVCKVNVDEQGELAREFKVAFIPMLVVFKDGKKSAQNSGLMSIEEIKELVEK